MENPIIDEFGTKKWYKDEKLHRDDGPACEYTSGYKAWFKEGKHHRLDGPAYISHDGYKAWYYEGKQIKCSSQEEFEKLIKLRMFW